MEHYFIAKEHSESDYFEFKANCMGNDLIFKSCDDIFSKDKVDYGTNVLINVVNNLSLSGDILDIGCGYGVIGIALAKVFIDANFYLYDINKTAVELSRYNSKKNSAKNIKEIELSNGYENIKMSFDYIITNPPIKAGKENLLKILIGAYEHLKENGKLVFVIKKKHGEDSIRKKLAEIFSEVEILKRDSGYYIICATK